jgi:hypothetical protein
MNQHEYDNQEEVFEDEFTPQQEKHQALTDIVMSDIIAKFEDDATEVLDILAHAIKQMALGNIDGECLISVIDAAFNAPFSERHNPINRFIIDAIYTEALAIAELDL